MLSSLWNIFTDRDVDIYVLKFLFHEFFCIKVVICNSNSILSGKDVISLACFNSIHVWPSPGISMCRNVGFVHVRVNVLNLLATVWIDSVFFHLHVDYRREVPVYFSISASNLLGLIKSADYSISTIVTDRIRKIVS